MKENGMKFKTHQHYYLKDGSEVIGVTTVLGQINKPQLLMWVYRLASSDLKFWEVSNKSKNIGTIAHYLIECKIKNEKVNESFLKDYSQNELDSAKICFDKFNQWFNQHNVIVVYSELQLVSEKYQYGGTIDIIAYVDNVLTLIDVKTGSGIYGESKYQLSAYRQLYEETYNTKINRCIIIHIPHKETNSFIEHRYTDSELTTAFWGFYHLLKFYSINKKVMK